MSKKFFIIFFLFDFKKNGDWGLGIGDWAQSPIPNHQTPNPNPHPQKKFKIIFK